MGIVLTNGTCCITVSETGKIGKTNNIEEAQTFNSCNVAMKKVFKAPGKCKGYYPYDTEDATWNTGKKQIGPSLAINLIPLSSSTKNGLLH